MQEERGGEDMRERNRSDHDLDLHDSMGQIGDYMESEGVRFVKECVPEILEKTDDGKIKVSAK